MIRTPLASRTRLLRQVLHVCAGLLVALLLTPVRAQDIQYMVIDGQVQPFQINTPADPMAGGLVTDVVKRIFADTPYQLKPVVAPWLRLVSMMEHKDLSNWLVYGWKPANLPNAECSRTTLAKWRTVLLMRKQNPEPKQIALDALYDKHLLLVHGYDYPGLDAHLKSHGGTIVDHRSLTPESALRMMDRARGDVYIEESFRLHFLMKQLQINPESFSEIDFSNVIPAQSVCLMYDKNMPQKIKTLIDQRMQAMIRSGEMDTIIQRYR